MPKKLLYIGIEDYSEKMYPHLYDVLTYSKSKFEFQSYIIRDRGFTFYNLGSSYKKLLLEIKAKLNFKSLFTLLAYKIILVNIKLLLDIAFKYLKFKQQIEEHKNKIRSILSENKFNILVIHDLFNLYLIPQEILYNKNIKKILWSFEVLSQDHQWPRESFLIRKMIEKCKSKIANIDEIYIQDYNRAAVFDSCLNTHLIPKKYLPVSIIKNIFTSDLRSFNQAVPNKEIVLAQIGSIHPLRSSIKLIKIHQQCERNIKLVLKGNISPEIQKNIIISENKPTIYPVSNSFNEMRGFLAGVDIGFIGLSSINLNSHFYSKAAGQFVEFANCAIPVITHGSDEFGDFIEKNHCGKHLKLDDLEDLPKAMHEIIDRYAYYSSGASSVFKKYYNLELYLGDLFDIN